MHLPLRYKNQDQVFCLHEEGETPYLSFRRLDETGLFQNAFSTRLGGVSEGHLSSMNLTFTKPGETPEHVLENYRRLGRAAGLAPERMVLSWQTHTLNIREATEADLGKGVLRQRDYRDVDGLVTRVPGLTLVTFYADCVPLYIADPVKRAIGLSHSGWRGTVGGMGALTVQRLADLYGSRPEDLICCIGPSICRDCFEVGPEVAEAFRDAFHEHQAEVVFGPFRTEAGEKYHIDLWRANELILLSAGVRRENIVTTNLCTRCNPEVFWSHRRHGEKRGNLAAFLSIREEGRSGA